MLKSYGAHEELKFLTMQGELNQRVWIIRAYPGDPWSPLPFLNTAS